jgi:hypothetical protein
MRKRRRRRLWDDYKIYDPKDGLDVNAISRNRKVSRHRTTMSMFDLDNISLDSRDRYKPVSIMRRVRRVNRERSFKINGCREKLNGRE